MDTSASDDLKELVEMLLEMSDEEIELLERLYKATAHVRSSGATREQKNEALERVLDEDPRLRDAFRALTRTRRPESGRPGGPSREQTGHS